MSYTSDSMLHRSLDDAEEALFIAYAEANDPPTLEGWSMYHPVCRTVWTRRGVGPETEGATCATCGQKNIDPIWCSKCGNGTVRPTSG